MTDDCRSYAVGTLGNLKAASCRVRETHHLLLGQKFGAFHAPYKPDPEACPEYQLRNSWTDDGQPGHLEFFKFLGVTQLDYFLGCSATPAQVGPTSVGTHCSGIISSSRRIPSPSGDGGSRGTWLTEQHQSCSITDISSKI